MPLIDRMKPASSGKRDVPADVKDRLDRGRKAMLRDAANRRLCQRFEKGDTYWYVNERGLLDFQSTVTSATGSGKPPHRVRSRINFIRPIIEAKVSAATQRIPSYAVAPTSTDPEDEGAARTAESVALYGYDKWRLRNASIKAVKLAIGGGGDAFALPYFDPNVGPYVEVDGRWVGTGEVKVLILSGNEVYWEAGVNFEDSRWWAVEQARPIEDVKLTPGFVKGLELSPDATTSDIPTDNKDRDQLVMVTDYYERPCAKYPQGRLMRFANGKQITDQRLVKQDAEYAWESYPLKDAEGDVLDEPVLHRLSYTLDPDTDRDLGLTWQLIDPQRTLQDAWNKITEWKNRCLNPQMKAPVGSLIDRPDDVPGAVRYYRPVGGLVPEWEQPVPIPDSLFRILGEIQGAMRHIGADADVADTDAAARTLSQVIEQAANRWQSFLGDLAEWHSRVMRHCLCLVARHYTEPRLLQVRGRFGPEPISDFLGASLHGQVDVRVLPESLAVKSRQQLQAETMAYADRGWISPQVAMATIQGGTAEKLTQGYELDIARANRIIQAIRTGTIMEMGTWLATDPMTGQPAELPVYMPRETDNTDIWKTVFGDWMKTDEYMRLGPEGQEATNLVYSGILSWEQMKAAQAAQMQAAQAEQLGMSNAAKPSSSGVPSTPESDSVPVPKSPTGLPPIQ